MKKNKWVCVLQTRDGFIKIQEMAHPTPTIEMSWWMPGLVKLSFDLMVIDSERKQAFYLLGGK